MLKLGTPIVDNPTGLPGMLVRFRMESGSNQYYLFQPRGLNPEDGQPVKRQWVTASRISGGTEVEMPPALLEALGVLESTVTDSASGFCGTVIALELHISGCIHCDVQPKGTEAKTGAPISSNNFDIRLLEGDRIPKLSEKERAISQTQRPSPIEGDRFKLRN